jgi:hypothetical protein
MHARSKAMKISSGKVMNRKFAAKDKGELSLTGSESIIGSRAATIIIAMITMLNAIIKYLNFTWNSPIITLERMIKESPFNVNVGNPR